MKYTLYIICFLLCAQFNFAQNKSAFKDGEWFSFEMSYSGFLKAGNATLEVKETKFKEKPVYHVVGKGWTTGVISWFFKVEDHYESYFDKYSGLPYKFVRQIDEGGHTKDLETEFDHDNNTAFVNNKKHNTQERSLQKKCRKNFITKKWSYNVAYFIRKHRPIRAKLIGHYNSRYNTHTKTYSEYFDPHFI